jgi:hypothetical protein
MHQKERTTLTLVQVITNFATRTLSQLFLVSVVIVGLLGVGLSKERFITPVFDPLLETNVVSHGAHSKVREALIYSGYQLKKRGLKRRSKRSFFLMPSTNEFVFRVRFSNKRVKTRFILNAEWDAKKKRLKSGYALRVNGGTLVLESIQNGKFKRVSETHKLWRFWYPKKLELVVVFKDGHLAAHFYDQKTEERHGSLYAEGLKVTGSYVGIFNQRRDRGPHSVSLMSSSELCVDRRKGPLGHSVVAKLDPNRDELSLDAMVIVGEEENPSPNCEGTADCQPSTVVRTDPLGLIHSMCTESLITVEPTPPLEYLDDSFRAARVIARVNPVDPKLRWRIRSPSMVEAALKAFHQQHPKRTRLRKLGVSHEGRGVFAIGIGDFSIDQDQIPQFFFNGTHHGNEPITTVVLMDMVEELLSSKPGEPLWELTQKSTFWLLPVVNPDGLERHLYQSRQFGRKNGAKSQKVQDENQNYGVDLNRNYPFMWGALGEKGSKTDPLSHHYRGSKAASEPETRAVMKLANEYPFVGVLSFHSGTVALLVPYTIDGAKNAKLNEAWTVSDELTKKLKAIQRKPFKVKRNLYPVDGVDEDWHRFEHGSLALIVEVARFTPLTDEDRRMLVEKNRKVWFGFASRFLTGPSVTIKTIDGAQNPVSARIDIDGMTPPNGERWRSRCPAGLYHRYLPKAGRYIARVNGHSNKSKKMEISVGLNERKHVTVVVSDADVMKRCLKRIEVFQ